MRKFLVLALAVSGFSFISDAQACGPDTDCVLEDGRTYRIRMPEGHDGVTKVGAIFFMHGYRGSAKGVMKNKNLGKTVSDLGLAFVAPKSSYEDWALPGDPSNSVPVELPYFESVIKDISEKFTVDTSKLMASGFSAGGMMTWNLACDRSHLFAAYAPIAGTFWEPAPKTCPTDPVSIIHMHGTTDKIVPLTGRPIRATHQGNVPNVLEMYSKHGGFEKSRSYQEAEFELQCEESKNDAGQILEICLHPGGHSMSSAYLGRAWNKFVELGIIK